MDFGDRLKQNRIKLGLSQEQLAEKMGVSRQAITKWETKKGLPDIDNMIILAHIFNMSLDELILEQAPLQNQQALFESETIYDVDCDKHFDIHLPHFRKIRITTSHDEKIHIKLTSDILENLNTLYKIKLDENKNKLDIDYIKKKDMTHYQGEECVDVTILLPQNYTEHCEIEAQTKELYIENIKLKRLEYDNRADQVFIKNTHGHIELTGKTDYDITIEGNCSQLDINQWHAKAIVHLIDFNNYQVLNKGRKCSIYYQRNGVILKEDLQLNGKNIVSLSGIRSELIIDYKQ